MATEEKNVVVQEELPAKEENQTNEKDSLINVDQEVPEEIFLLKDEGSLVNKDLLPDMEENLSSLLLDTEHALLVKEDFLPDEENVLLEKEGFFLSAQDNLQVKEEVLLVKGEQVLGVHKEASVKDSEAVIIENVPENGNIRLEDLSKNLASFEDINKKETVVVEETACIPNEDLKTTDTPKSLTTVNGQTKVLKKIVGKEVKKTPEKRGMKIKERFSTVKNNEKYKEAVKVPEPETLRDKEENTKIVLKKLVKNSSKQEVKEKVCTVNVVHSTYKEEKPVVKKDLKASKEEIKEEVCTGNEERHEDEERKILKNVVKKTIKGTAVHSEKDDLKKPETETSNNGKMTRKVLVKKIVRRLVRLRKREE